MAATLNINFIIIANTPTDQYYAHITVWTVVHTVLTATSQSNGNGQTSTPHRIQSPNSLTDYDKTLHNLLRPRDEHVTPNLCQSAVRERLAKYVKYKVSLFYFLFFSPDSPTEVTRAYNFTRDGSKHALWRKEVPFGVHTMADNILGVQISPKTVKKWSSISMFERPRTDSRRMTS